MELKKPKLSKGPRQKFIDLYYESPNYCLNCGKLIEISEFKPPSAAKNRKFCNKSCNITYHNRLSPKTPKIMKNPNCKVCGKEIEINRGPLDRLSHRKYCDVCQLERRRELIYRNNKIDPANGFHSLTKGQVRATSRDAQRTRTRIAQHAQVVYRWSGKPYTCMACGYTLHVNICHVKNIRDFSENTLVSEINHIDNLITLCPTHHWEFDHGFWQLPIEQKKE